MNKNPKCLLSIAMIMKNEEHNLDRALGSIKDYVDEIIVVDTGSTDKSVEVAKKYTDKIYFHEWKDDFSEARNYSLQFSTCEWVLIYDADEEVKEDFADIREFLKNLPDDVNTVYLPTISYLDWDLKKTEVASTARIFRNGTVHYENIVHNQPIYKGKVVEGPFKIYHYGYIWTRKLKSKKYDRTKNLLVKMLNEQKMSNLERIYYLCQLYKTESIYEYRYNKYPIVEEIFSLIEKEKRASSIVFEVFFLHGLDLMNKGLYDLAENIFNYTLRINDYNPDPYYGLLGIDERRKDFEKVIEHGERFFELIRNVEEHPEKYGWTIITIKYKATARTILNIAYLKKGLIEKFKENYYLISKESLKTGEDLAKFLRLLSEHILSLDDETYLSISEEIDNLLTESANIGVKLNIADFIDKDLKSGRKINLDLYKKHAKTKFEEFIIEKIASNKDSLVEYILGDNVIDGVKRYGVGGLIFYFENFKGDVVERLKILNEIRKIEDGVLKGISLTLIADSYLKLGNFKLAIDYYRKSVEALPELSQFVKPVLEDLTTKLDTDIDGAFEEIKEFYTKGKEFFTDLPKNFDINELRKLYLISDSDFSKYVSAVYSFEVDPEKSKKLLESIEDKDKFYFYYLRYAKFFEKSEDEKDLEKAYNLHIEACENNFNLADITLGIYKYDGFYPSEKVDQQRDKIVWVRNISQKHSGLGVISPVRAWKRSEENKYYYAYPFPKSEALKVYKERLKNFNLQKFAVNKVDLLTTLNEIVFSDACVLENDEEYVKISKSACHELGIDITENSQNIISFELLNVEKDLSLLKHYRKGILFYFVPDFEDPEDMAWYYPLFRIFRTRKDIDNTLKKLNTSKVKHIVLNKNLRAVIFER
ncbi:MAG: tetratricopeptide repeat-containing glycosyltransferase family 2 protein [Fervidobacterium sp.]